MKILVIDVGGTHLKINLGAASTVMCSAQANCDVKCAGNCTVTCATTATCKLSCGVDDGGVAGMTCPDGRIVCGGGC